MSSSPLLMPMATLALWTLNVLTFTEIQRLIAINAGRVKLEDFRYGDGPKVPADIAVGNRNYMNLLESPVLFYVAALAAMQLGGADVWMVRLAWAFVALRIAHSAIHLINKAFIPRIVAFVASLIVLALMWGKLALGW
jgi:hypothetical protein